MKCYLILTFQPYAWFYHDVSVKLVHWKPIEDELIVLQATVKVIVNQNRTTDLYQIKPMRETPI